MPLFRSLANTCLRLRVCSVASSSLQGHEPQPARLICPWNFPGKNTGVGCHFLLQRIFPSQRSNLHLLASPALVDGFFTTSAPWGAPAICYHQYPYMKRTLGHSFRKKSCEVMGRKQPYTRGGIASGKLILLKPDLRLFLEL